MPPMQALIEISKSEIKRAPASTLPYGRKTLREGFSDVSMPARCGAVEIWFLRGFC